VPLREIQRVVKQGGKAWFSTLLDGSLTELKNVWRKVDAYQHVNAFLSSKQVKLALAQAGCSTHHIYPSDLKMLGSAPFSLRRKELAFRQDTDLKI
jgi:hypothetical protein